MYFIGLRVKISINDAFLSLKIVFILAYTADPDNACLFDLILYVPVNYFFSHYRTYYF